jgi:GH18 family chitinase/uncharacterized protein with beta-barrel porin domain
MNTWRQIKKFSRLLVFMLLLWWTGGEAAALEIVGYYANWDIYKTPTNYTVDNIPLNKLTQLDYAFIGLAYTQNEDKSITTYTGGLVSLDTGADFTYAYDPKGDLPACNGNIARLTSYRDILYPDLKLLFSIGGANYSWEAWTGTTEVGSKKVIGFVNDPEKRQKFVNDCVTWVSQYNFNGIDIDWEYPAIEGDKALFTTLLQELRVALNEQGVKDGKTYYLSIAVGVGPDKLYHVDIPAVAAIVDYINLMTYDYAGGYTANKTTGDKITGLNAPLYENPNFPIWDPQMNNAAWVVNYYLEAIKNLPPETKSKLILGLPLYGKSWVNVPGTNNGLFQTGTFESGDKGAPLYWQIMQLVTDPRYKSYWDDLAKVPYLYSSDGNFISYDNLASTAQKLNYLKSQSLGGAMFWELYGDIHDVNDPESLVGYVYNGLNSPNLILDAAQSLSTGTLWSFDAIVGATAAGNFIQTGDSTHNVTYDLVLGRDIGSSGEYSLADTAGLYSTNTYVGYNGAGTFEQTGGSHYAYESLTLAANPGSTGTYNLSGGILYPGYILEVGAGGAFNQTGGTVSGLLFNTGINVSGAYNLSGGSLYTGYILQVDAGGTFEQTGGTVTGLLFNTAITVSGAYNLSSGALYPGSTLEVGAGGTFNQTGGTVDGSLLNTGINVSGTYNLSSGSLYTGSTLVVPSGGTFNQTGGTVNNQLFNKGIDVSGAYNLSSGILNVGTLYLNTGGGFNYTGGDLSYQSLNIHQGGNFTGNLTNNSTTTVNGTFTGDLTNNAGGLINGTGTITGALVNNGTVNPGNSPGTLTVGTYTSNPGSTQVAEIASATNYDRIVTTAAGGATLNGGTLSPQLLNGYLPSTNTVFHVIETTGGGTVTGAFDGIDNNRMGASRTLFWQALYTNTTADLKAVGNYTPPDLSLSINQRSVGNALNSLAPSTNGGDLLTVLDAINALTSDSGVRAAYNEISPGKYAALGTMSMPITHLQFQYLQNRLARERWEAELGREALSAGGGGFMRGFNFNYDSSSKMMLAASNMTVSDAGTRYINHGVQPRWGVYLEPMANWGTLSATANMVGYRYKNFGFTLGAEYWVMDNLLVGVNTGYSKTLGSAGGTGGDLNANVIPFNVYGAYFLKGFYANAMVGYTYSGYDMERNIAFGTINRTAKASTSGNQFQLGAETGYDAKIGNAVVGPVLSLQYATQTVGGFTESNAGALNLKVGSQSANSVQSGVGVRASFKAKVGGVPVKPQVSVTWQHEFSDNTRGLNASLAAGGSTINFRTDRIGQDFALISLDVPAKITKNLVANVGYTAEVGRDKSTNMGVNLGLKLKW